MAEQQDVYADLSALRFIIPGVLVFVLLAGGAFAGYQFLGPDSSDDQASTGSSEVAQVAPLDPAAAAGLAADQFAVALQQRRFDGVQFAFGEAAAAQQELAGITAGLGGYSLNVERAPVTLVDDANATAPIVLTWTLGDGVVFETQGDLDLVLIGTNWLVDWEPSILEQSLDPGDVLIRERAVPPRAPILGRDGAPLVENRPVVSVGVIPRQSNDIPALTATLGQLLGEDVEEMRAKIAPSPSDSNVPIAVRRPEQIEGVRSQLESLPGVVVEESSFPLAPNDRFGRAFLGRSAEVTKEIIDEAPDVFVVGDIAGRSGLQRQHNLRLAGRPGFQIRIDRRFPTISTPDTTSAADDPQPETTVGPDSGASTTTPTPQVDDPDIAFRSPTEPGTALSLTIDPRVQNAAEDALGQTQLPSTLVAIEISTGRVLAMANGPGAAVNNFATTGQYAPGSVFKVVTAFAAVERGFDLNTPLDCPESLNVNGREFRNAEGEVLGVVPLRRAFALSCNTAFINLSNNLDNGDFAAAARRLGIGAQYNLGIDAFSGSVPTPGGPVEKAATSFGQSRVLVSPLSAAVMVASVAGGTYRPPIFVDDPDLVVVGPAEEPLNPVAAEQTRQMMRSVVTEGTGRAVSNVAGGPVSGKTGTAEFGDEVPPRAHAWFVGFQGDVAFAVFVEGGEFGGATAAPIAGSFLNTLAQ